MATEPADFARRLAHPRYPRSSRYDPGWVLDNMMGPHPLWLAESVAAVMALVPGDRVMDLGCGTALTSMFLAREFGVRVSAVDLWIDAAANEERIGQAGLAEVVEAVHADAMALPFADDSFDAVVTVDAYHYFGTGPDALGAVLRVVRRGGRLGVAVPGLSHEIDAWPAHLAPWWQDGFETFHSPQWWRRHWEGSGLVTVDRADRVPHGHDDWRTWGQIADDWAVAHGAEPYGEEVAMLRADVAGLLGFTRLVATKR